MIKTITSNIAGYVFHIDENAFDKLDAYLNTIRSYFNDSQGKDEIIADIEARLAEMLHERIGDMKKVVTMEDVNQVIIVMGQPEAFIDDDAENAAWTDSKSDRKSSGAKRLFRDPDNKVVGGVCSGVSNYLGIEDAIWLRLALITSIFFLGTGFMLYLILWIIIPEAKTTADKLQMRGETVTVSNIEKKVNEEMETVKERWNNMNGNSSTARKIGNGFHRVLSLLLNLFTMFIKFFARVVGFFFVVMGLLGLFSALAIPLGLPTIISLSSDSIISSIDVQDILHNMVGGTNMFIWMMIAFVLMVGIPMLALAFVGIKLLFNFRTHTKGIALSFLGLWIIGVVMTFTLATIIASDFSSEGVKTETVELELNSDPLQVIHLALNHELGEDEPTDQVEIFNMNMVTSGNTTRLYGKPELDITMAKTGGPKLIIKRSCRAKKKQDAVERATKIDYGFIVNDTSILYNGYFAIPENELWRTQEVKLELQIPVGYTVFLSDELSKIIYDIDNVTNTYDGDMVGRRWTMTPQGLTCVDCNGISKPNKSRHGRNTSFDDDWNEADRVLQIEQEKLELEMEKRKLELEKMRNELKKERESAAEEANAGDSSSESEEILLKRVISAKYWVSPNIYRTVNITYPG